MAFTLTRPWKRLPFCSSWDKCPLRAQMTALLCCSPCLSIMTIIQYALHLPVSCVLCRVFQHRGPQLLLLHCAFEIKQSRDNPRTFGLLSKCLWCTKCTARIACRSWFCSFMYIKCWKRRDTLSKADHQTYLKHVVKQPKHFSEAAYLMRIIPVVRESAAILGHVREYSE